MLAVEKVVTWDGVAALQESWERLFQSAGGRFYTSYAWISHWARCFGHEYTPFFLIAKEEGKVVAICPMVMAKKAWRRLPVRFLSLCINGHSPFGGIVAPREEEGISRAVWSFLKNDPEWDVLALANTRRDLPGHALEREAPSSGLRSIAASRFEHCLKFEGTWDAYWQSQSKNFKRTFKRTLTTLEGRGAVSTRDYGSPSEFREGMSIFLTVDSSSWKKTSGEAIADFALLVRYYTGIDAAIPRPAESFVTVLSAGDSPLAALLVVVNDGWMYCLKMSFVEDLESASPGLLLVTLAIRKGWERGLKGVRFLSGHHTWARFKGGGEELTTRLVFNKTVRGRLASGLETLRERVSSRKAETTNRES